MDKRLLAGLMRAPRQRRRDPHQSRRHDTNFSVLSGRLVFRSEFVTPRNDHLKYAAILARPAYPSDYRFQWCHRRTRTRVELSAAMWW